MQNVSHSTFIFGAGDGKVEHETSGKPKISNEFAEWQTSLRCSLRSQAGSAPSSLASKKTEPQGLCLSCERAVKRCVK